ncbi:hypothetical protein ACFL4V_00665 [Candidatus Latescibacterota bacterium]
MNREAPNNKMELTAGILHDAVCLGGGGENRKCSVRYEAAAHPERSK